MALHWPMLDALLGGTSAMRLIREKLLPRQPREDKDDYEYRLSTATLFPALARTVGVMVGKPFSKQLVLSDKVPQRLVELAQDIDGEGRSLHVFASDLMYGLIAFGFGGVLVDFTRTDGQIKTQADEKTSGVRPYWVYIRHDQILGWRAGKKDGSTVLTQLRIAESSEVEDGKYGTKTVNRVRVYTPGAWELYEEVSGTYQMVDRGETTLPAIAFVPFYGRRIGFMRGVSPLLDLAHQNVKHWQQQSDQDDSTRFARKRLLVASGVDKDKMNSATAGAGYMLSLPENASVAVVQGSAESVSVGRSELDALEAQMIQTGAELLTAKPGSRTATEAANDAEANKSDLQRIVESFEDALDQALQFTADWLGLPDGGSVSLFKDFAAGSLSEASAQLLLSLQQGAVITKETLIREQQRRGILSPDLEPAAELEAVAQEGPSLGTIGDGHSQ